MNRTTPGDKGIKQGVRQEIDLNMGQHKDVMTLREASRYLGVSPDTLYKYLSERRIPAFKLGNRWRFKKDLLDRWMDKVSERVLEVKTTRVAKSTAGKGH